MRSLTAGQRSGRREKTEMRGEGEDWIREGKQRFSVLLFLSLQLAVFSHTQTPAIFLPWECIWLQRSSLSYIHRHTVLFISYLFPLSVKPFFVQICCWTLQRFSDVLRLSIALYQNRYDNKLRICIYSYFISFSSKMADNKLPQPLELWIEGPWCGVLFCHTLKI